MSRLREPPPHGTRSRYTCIRHPCRCFACCNANREYRASKRGYWRGYVDATPVRDHLLELAAHHVGRRAVADVTGISDRSLFEIRAGRVRRVRVHYATAILAVTPDARANNSLVPGGPTRRLINQLVRWGFTHKEIARRLGSKAVVPQLHWKNRKRIKARNAMRVRRLHSLIAME